MQLSHGHDAVGLPHPRLDVGDQTDNVRVRDRVHERPDCLEVEQSHLQWGGMGDRVYF